MIERDACDPYELSGKMRKVGMEVVMFFTATYVQQDAEERELWLLASSRAGVWTNSE
jgi:hypothetical protein